jgi:hypothetical protein
MRRWAVGLVLVAAVGLGVYAWRGRASSVPPPSEAPAGLKAQVRSFGEGARERLSEVGKEIDDLKVSASVRTALSLNRSLRSSSIDVAAENGVVTLGGRVDGEEEGREALAAAVPASRGCQPDRGGGGPAPAPGRTLGETLEDRTVETRVGLALSRPRAPGRGHHGAGHRRRSRSGRSGGETERERAADDPRHGLGGRRRGPDAVRAVGPTRASRAEARQPPSAP